MNPPSSSATASIASGRQWVSVARYCGLASREGGKRLRRIEHQDAVAPEILDERAVRRVLQGLRPAGVGPGEHLRVDARFERRRHDHERDPACLEIAPEPRDGLAGIGALRRALLAGPAMESGRGATPAFQLRRIEEAAAGDVPDIRAIEQPSLTPLIDAARCRRQANR